MVTKKMKYVVVQVATKLSNAQLKSAAKDALAYWSEDNELDIDVKRVMVDDAAK